MTTPAAHQSLQAITLAQWLPVLQRWLGMRHALVVGHSQQALSLLNSDPAALTLFKSGSPAANPVPTPAAHALSSHAAVHTRPWLIAEHTGPATFHQASLPSESGLLPATALTACWPGIKAVGQHEAQALSLDDACTQASAEHAWASPPQWLWIGCLPATALLRGATRLLQQVDVVVVRVQLNTGSHPDASLYGAQALLLAKGFVLCGVESERNANLGNALFVRDYLKAHSANRQVIDELSMAYRDLQCQLKAVTQIKDAEIFAKIESNRQRDELAKAYLDLQVQLSTETGIKEAEIAAKIEANRERDKLAKAYGDLQCVLSEEAKAKKAVEAANAESETQLDEILKAKIELQAQLDTQLEESAQAQVELQKQLFIETQAKALTQQQNETLAREKAQLIAICDSLMQEKRELKVQVDLKTLAKIELEERIALTRII